MDNLEFIWGWSPNSVQPPSFLTWDDIYIYYNHKTHKYYFQVDTDLYHYKDKEAAWSEFGRLLEIEKAFRNFLCEKGIPLFSEICYADLDQEGADTLSELYTKFFITIMGYQAYLDRLS